jgi:REP element-mobilizing transposase RayT
MELLLPNTVYHIYNHSIGNEQLFDTCQNYFFFLNKFQRYLLPVVETYSYCLMPNHFHFVVKVRKEYEIVAILPDAYRKKYENEDLPENKELIVSKYVSRQFSNLFSSYTQAFNKWVKRRGSLFLKNFKRNKVDSREYFVQVVKYVHFNPVKHGFVNRMEDWEYSSFNLLLSSSNTFLERDAVFAMFEGRVNFIETHLDMYGDD